MCETCYRRAVTEATFMAPESNFPQKPFKNIAELYGQHPFKFPSLLGYRMWCAGRIGIRHLVRWSLSDSFEFKQAPSGETRTRPRPAANRASHEPGQPQRLHLIRGRMDGTQVPRDGPTNLPVVVATGIPSLQT